MRILTANKYALLIHLSYFSLDWRTTHVINDSNSALRFSFYTVFQYSEDRSSIVLVEVRSLYLAYKKCPVERLLQTCRAAVNSQDASCIQQATGLNLCSGLFSQLNPFEQASLLAKFVDFFKYHCYYLLASHQSLDATSVLTRAWWDTYLTVDLIVLISYGLFSN